MAFLTIASEIRNQIIALATSDPADVTKLSIHNRRLDEISSTNDPIDISFWNGSLLFVCKQLREEVRPFLTSSIEWRFRQGNAVDFSLSTKQHYFDRTVAVELNTKFNHEFPVSRFRTLEQLQLRRTDENKAKLELSENYTEAVQQIDRCIGDLGFVSRAKDMLLERQWIKALLRHSERKFVVQDTIDIEGLWNPLQAHKKKMLALVYDVDTLKVLQRVALTPEAGHPPAQNMRVWQNGMIKSYLLRCKEGNGPDYGRPDVIRYSTDVWPSDA